MDAALDHAGLMNRIYRRQRHIYDATRKYFLLGRDPMLAGLAPPDGGSVLEIGCGTGRNLVRAAQLYPRAAFFGIDISSEMLASAGASLAAAGLGGHVRLALADASGFEPRRAFGQPRFDRIFISYALSMIPQWDEAIERAVAMLAPGGALHIVDFGDLAGLPPPCRAVLYKWLALHSVTPRTTLFPSARRIAHRCGCSAEEWRLMRGYAWLAIIRRPSN